MLELSRLTADIAEALVRVDRKRLRHKNFQPGIGPFGEAAAIRAALEELSAMDADEYGAARIQRNPDLLIPGSWAIEAKIARPFGDNGRPAEHWSENLLHPYRGNVS